MTNRMDDDSTVEVSSPIAGWHAAFRVEIDKN
jgi:hypothetical protein